MTRTLHQCRWLSLVPAAYFVAGAFLLTGCDDGRTTGSAAAPSQEAVKAQDQMYEFMKKNPKFGKASSKPKINRGPVIEK